MKNFIPTKQLKWIKKQIPQWKNLLVPGILAVGLVIGFASKKTIADDGSTGRGALFGGLTGATIGGIAGGGRGAAIGGVAGLGLGALIGSSRSSRSGKDPYRELDKMKRKRNKLQDRLDRSKSERKQVRIQQQLNRQNDRINDLEGRLGMQRQRPRQSYQPSYVRRG